MYSSAATVKGRIRHCLCVATSDKVVGPYVSSAEQLWMCPLTDGGVIDNSGFTDQMDGSRRIVCPLDANSNGH